MGLGVVRIILILGLTQTRIKKEDKEIGLKLKYR